MFNKHKYKIQKFVITVQEKNNIGNSKMSDKEINNKKLTGLLSWSEEAQGPSSEPPFPIQWPQTLETMDGESSADGTNGGDELTAMDLDTTDAAGEDTSMGEDILPSGNNNNGAVGVGVGVGGVNGNNNHNKRKRKRTRRNKRKGVHFVIKSKYLHAVHSGVYSQFYHKRKYENKQLGAEATQEEINEIKEIVKDNYGTADLFGERYHSHIQDHNVAVDFMFVILQPHRAPEVPGDIHYHSLVKLSKLLHTTSPSIINVDSAVIGHLLKYSRQVNYTNQFAFVFLLYLFTFMLIWFCVEICIFI